MQDARTRSTRGRARSALLVLLTALAVALGADPALAIDAAGGDARLAKRLDTALRVPALRGARVSALVVVDGSGETIFERTPDRPLTPASNAKVLTAIAALNAFGPTYQFETEVRSDAPPDEAGAVGRLAVRGVGDPVLNSEDWWRLAAALRHEGLRRIRGDLVLDDSAFDRHRWHRRWGRTSSRAYHAPVGALNANYGAFEVSVTPGDAPGEPVAVAVSPPVPYLEVSNAAKTGSPGARSSLVVDRRARPGGETVVVRGTMPAGGSPRTYYRSVLDPTGYAGAVFRMQLEAVGISLEGALVRGDARALGYELMRFKGRPLSEIVRLFVKYSNNTVAETLVKALGAREGAIGSWENGVPEVGRSLAEMGIDGEGIALVDGSGLSYENKVSPRALVDALRAARHSFDFGPEFVSALPIAASDGTLAERANGAHHRVRAKTGLLNGVTGLSGFARLGDGRLAVFSVLVNGYRSGDDLAMGALDGFVSELVAASGGATASR
ncbi:MAG: D-alanyl-D-alanine carboxypeptidase/D-alanyl-D-alanine endopeptidase [Myxococcota bacterium]